jgi:MFS family permease
VAIVLLVFMGAGSISFIATNNATLQLRADPAMRGRIMSLNAIAFLGSTPIGAPLLGYISDISNPRISLLVGGVATLLASVPLFFVATRQRAVVGAALVDGVVVAADEESNVVPLPLRSGVRTDPAARRTS